VRLGVLSDDTLEAITLPAAMQELPTVLGKPLDQTFDSLEAHLLQLAERQCRSDSCKANAKKWADLEENKAIAVRTQGLGFGWKNNAPSAIVSMVQAIYACNHARNSPVGLCRAESVNGYDVRHLYTQAAQEHSKALEDLRVPAEKFYGNEEYGGALTSAKGYRLSDVHDATPQSLAHIRTIGTQDLAKALLDPVRPVVIDVWGGANDALPTAETLLNGGLAFDNSEKELPYHQRFTALLNLLAPDKNRPIVFYCTGHDCWLSANAAMRAVEAGYTQVLWYRGGYSAWKAAALPTALLQLQAVAY
jgi:PQQ-dependent catabolism-associated CXXCW motif protein